jgi:ribonuclease HI
VEKMFNVRLYADGASSNNQDPEKRCGGIGIVLVYDDSKGERHTKEVSGTYIGITNNRAELKAVLEGLKLIKPDLRKRTNVEVISDSNITVMTFNSWIESWKKRGWKKSNKSTPENLDIIQAIDELIKEFNSVKFRHVESRKGDDSAEDNLYNNKADKLASIAAGSRGN